MSPDTEALACRGLYAGYGRTPVLHDIGLRVRRGRVTALLGPNGAGKTTLLRALSAEIPRTGQVTVNGRRPRMSSPRAAARCGVAHVPEGRGTLAELSVEDNLRVGGYLLARRDRAIAMAEAYERFPRLAERRKQRAGTLSGGEQQLLALARGLMLRPTVLLVDEPSLGLAPRLAAEFFDTLAGLAADDGLSALIVEQNARLALRVADEVHLLRSGRITRSGGPAEFADTPGLVESYLGGDRR